MSKPAPKPKKKTARQIAATKAVELALTNLLNSNTVIFNKAIGTAASIQTGLDASDGERIADIADRLLRGRL